ncbi:hypothetical protein NB636_01095 [Oxalobacter aliiformigenes]|uniref:hypothetical protein n=1 Tax=Oxalobacter aliiformigenes TaxID=2946593 RepID=UPI0022AEC257|nr:hypothetical protein [Oxalobacter aliiformigenes]MCZ4064111.1 hypothetical protein [Oxalobacter aliiformigenes]WAV99487.1 hypothetical protein NB636_01095 [Oxalobacter aliiformigenes]
MGDGTFLIARVLPRCAVMWLIDASLEGEPGSKKRMIAIDEATERCKRHYPEYFKGRHTGGRN